MPGQWIGGGEKPTWEGTAHQCHHPIRRGDRLYISYWHGGFVILDIADMSRPKYISGYNWSPTYPSPIHTTLPIPWKLMNRDVMVVSDEEAGKRAPTPSAFMWMVDITDETQPGADLDVQSGRKPISIAPGHQYGAHQPAEQVYDNKMFVTWFSGGLRVVDISNPYLPDGDRLLRPRTRPRPKDGQEQRCFPRRQRLAVFDRPARRSGDTRVPELTTKR